MKTKRAKKNMVNILSILKCIVALCLVAVIATSAYSAMVCTDAGFTNLSNERYRQIIECNFDAAPSIASDDIPDSAMARINRGYLYKMAFIPGNTGPTSGSDLKISDSDGVVILDPAGNGLNVLLASTVTSAVHGDAAYVTGGTRIFYPMGDGKPWTMTVTGNTTDNSSFTAILHITPDH